MFDALISKDIWPKPMVENEREYYFARAAEERSIAEMTSDGCAKAVHLELARRYADLADGKV